MVAVTPDVYFLSFFTAFVWGVNQIFSKRGMAAGGDFRQGALMVAGVTSVVYWLALAVDRSQIGTLLALAPTDFGVFLLAGTFWAAGWLSTYTGVHRLGASVNSAGVNTRPLFSAVLGVAFLGELLSPVAGVGILLVVVGLVVLSLSRGGDIGGWSYTDLVFPLGSAGAFSLANVLRRFGLSETPATVLHGLALNSTMAVLLLVTYLVVRRRTAVLRAPRRSYGYFLMTALGTSLALFTLFTALDRGPVVIVDPITGTAPLFTAVAAYLFLSDLERVTKGLLAGAILVVVGAAIITIATS